ncbi:hypothetical protein, partial [Actinomadura rubrisoli]|uniref:hypothetical protein n=1 Tax=Actinomadura rubrisoli TaxID=2530368 RepID=UPI001A9F9E26
PTGTGTRDLAWWRLAATTHAITPAAGKTLALLIAVVAGLGAGLVVALVNGFGAGVGVWFSSGLCAGTMIAVTAEDWAREPPGYADIRVRQRIAGLIRELALNLVFWLFTLGLLIGVLAGYNSGLAAGLRAWLIVGLGFGLMSGLLFVPPDWAETPAHAGHAQTPMNNWHADRTLSLFRFTLSGSVIGLGFGLMFWFANGPANGLAALLAAGLVSGLSFGLGMGHHRAWLAYLVATHRLAWARLLPRRLMPFLDDCHRLGLLRAVGPLYQFRHAELHDHLAATYQPPA